MNAAGTAASAAIYGLAVLLLVAIPAARAGDAGLVRVGQIELTGTRGRIDHIGADLKKDRLYIAALGNDSVEVVDLKAGRRERSLSGFGEPQGILAVPGLDRVYVANGSADRVDVLDGTSFASVRRVGGMKDADNVRYDPAARKVYVGYGGGALRVLEAEKGGLLGDIALAGHPESFQLETNGPRIFVNIPDVHQIAVVDRGKGAVVATWPVAGAGANFPMALDETGRRLFIGARSPAVMLVYDIDTGHVVARESIGQDADDIFFDPVRKRLYVICGEGLLDIVRQVDPDHYRMEARVGTAPRARTGLFVPETGMLYVAAPAGGVNPARLLMYRAR